MFPLLTHVFYMLVVVGVAVWGCSRSTSLGLQEKIVFGLAVVAILWTSLFIWWARGLSSEIAPYTSMLSGGLLVVGFVLNFLPKKTWWWKWFPFGVSIVIFATSVYWFQGATNNLLYSGFKNLIT